jgi:hypothetical protein
MHLRRALLSIAVLTVSACPPPPAPTSIYGTWNYNDCSGTPVATVVVNQGGTMTYQSEAGSGTGFWQSQQGSFNFSVMIDSSPSATIVFDGDIGSFSYMEGMTTSDQPPTQLCVIMSR